MKVIDTDTGYASMKDTVAGVIKVYVDASYRAGDSRDREDIACFGSGWAIEGSTGLLDGHGVNVFWDAPTPDSSIAELRSMLSFLDTLYDHYPHMLTLDNTLVLHCDNLSLIKELQNASKNSDFARKSYKRYGKDYARIVYYMSVVGLEFRWIKGHGSNGFHCLADQMAHKGFQNAVKGNAFHGPVRLSFIQEKIIRNGLACLETGKTVNELLAELKLDRAEFYRERNRQALQGIRPMRVVREVAAA